MDRTKIFHPEPRAIAPAPRQLLAISIVDLADNDREPPLDAFDLAIMTVNPGGIHCKSWPTSTANPGRHPLQILAVPTANLG